MSRVWWKRAAAESLEAMHSQRFRTHTHTAGKRRHHRPPPPIPTGTRGRRVRRLCCIHPPLARTHTHTHYMSNARFSPLHLPSPLAHTFLFIIFRVKIRELAAKFSPSPRGGESTSNKPKRVTKTALRLGRAASTPAKSHVEIPFKRGASPRVRLRARVVATHKGKKPHKRVMSENISALQKKISRGLSARGGKGAAADVSGFFLFFLQ